MPKALDQGELRPQGDEGATSSARVLSYHGSAVREKQVRRSWHVYVALVLCWAPSAALVVLVCMEVVLEMQGKWLIGPRGLLNAGVASPLAVMWVILSYRAVVLASRRATHTLLLLCGVLAPLAALLMIPVLLAIWRMRWFDGREVAFGAINVGLWFVMVSMEIWSRRLEAKADEG